MEQISKRKKIIHPLYIIQYNDKAIADLKWNRKTEVRQRVKVNFKNGPRGISIRWTPKKRENKRDREQVYKVYTYLYKLSFFYKIITDSFFSRRTLCTLYTFKLFIKIMNKK